MESNTNNETENGNGRTGSIKAKLPGGISLDIKGVWFSLIMVLVVTMSIMGMFAYFYVQNISDQHQALAASIEDSTDQHSEILVQLKLMTYILSLPQEERPRLIPPVEIYGQIERNAPAPKKSTTSKHKRNDLE